MNSNQQPSALNAAAAPGFILQLRCPDRPGVMAAVTSAICRLGGDIRDAAHYADRRSGVFFIRFHLVLDEAKGRSLEELQAGFAAVAAEHGLEASWHALASKMRTLLAVSKQRHCLVDLLHRWQTGLLHTDIVGVVSNHEDLRSLTEWHGLPFHHFPVNDANRRDQEAAILGLMSWERADLLVLARYMQIFSDETASALAGRCINIHHAFLPGFTGPQPYLQAYRRGVKLIGATAHYVNSDLDAGPIIEQAVERVTHATSAQEMENLGKDVEARVLARAVRWHVEHRVMRNGNTTVVFS